MWLWLFFLFNRQPEKRFRGSDLFWVLVLKGLVGLHRTFNFSFFSITSRGIDLDYCDIEWFALETNRDQSVVFEIASKYN